VRINGAGEETRTLDVHLGKVVLYQLSYARESGVGSDCPPPCRQHHLRFEAVEAAPGLALGAWRRPDPSRGPSSRSRPACSSRSPRRTPGHLGQHGAQDRGLQAGDDLLGPQDHARGVAPVLDEEDRAVRQPGEQAGVAHADDRRRIEQDAVVAARSDARRSRRRFA
jgi:hypothetical protein